MKRNLELVASLGLVVVLLFSGIALGQSKKRKRVPKPRSRQEVTTMGAGSDHDVEWTRNPKTGTLEATSPNNPDENYTSPLDAIKSSKGRRSEGNISAANAGENLAADEYPFPCLCPDQHSALVATAKGQGQTEWLDGILYHQPTFKGQCTGISSGALAGVWVMDTLEECPESIFNTPPEVPYETTFIQMSDGSYKQLGGRHYSGTSDPTLTLKPIGNNLYGASYKLSGEEGLFEVGVNGDVIRYSYKRNVYFDGRPRADWIICTTSGHRKLPNIRR
ncbi:MAG: hypothetical protein JOZ96_17860 [Acidobacteria bacterium]|nr:hypothetical protein [Acidobacteriota bacterium]